MTDSSLTPEVEAQILAFIRAGGYPHVAAEAAGVPAAVFARCLARARRRDAPEHLRQFAADVRKAAAQARLRAEVHAYDKDPELWLTKGPGRERAGCPGWSGLVRPDPQATAAGEDPPDVLALVATLARVLQPHPEARAAVLQALNEDLDAETARHSSANLHPQL
jgi:hypothetical protein